ncbi:MAG: hypothetical protein IPG78_18400 [Ignavibacteria bacterium]|nr:hypothetical protein [Ignavibacteria bacterium]
MTNTQSNDDGTLGEDEFRFLTRRAKEGFGMIFTCASHVTADGQGWRGELAIFDDKHIEGLTRLAKGIHEYGSLGIVQIFHGGARSPESLTGKQPWSASAHTMTFSKDSTEVREATEEDIEKQRKHLLRQHVGHTKRALTESNCTELTDIFCISSSAHSQTTARISGAEVLKTGYA